MIAENKKRIIGKIFFISTILILIYYLYVLFCDFSTLNGAFIHIDEYFTLGFIRFPVNELITITANDVHPPLYYVLLKIINNSSIINDSVFTIFIFRLFSLTPYLIILIVSSTLIQKKYGWLSAGIFSFSLLCMSNFSQFYILIRMYSWAILLMLLTFLSIIKIIENNSKKSWALLTIFSILGAYTHYFIAISLVVLFISLSCYFLLNKKWNELKFELLSSALIIISYIPWAFTLFHQLTQVHNGYWIEPLDFYDIIDCLSFYAVNLDVIIYIKIFSIILLILITIAIINKYREEQTNENVLMLLGITTFFGTLLTSIIVSIMFKPILIARYLIIPSVVLWLTISIYIGQLKNEKILGILIILLLFFGMIGILNFNSYQTELGRSSEVNQFCENLMSNVTIICINKQPTILFNGYFNNCDVYTTAPDLYGVKLRKVNQTVPINLILKEKIPRLIDETNGTVYIIKIKSEDIDLENYKLEDEKSISVYHFYKVLN